MLTQTNMNLAEPIFKLWDNIDSLRRSPRPAIYDFSRLQEDSETGKSIHTTGWVDVDKSFIDGLTHAVNLVAFAIFSDLEESQVDAKLEELRECWEQYQQQQAEIEAERRNEQALYGPW